ncbi:MAG: DNA internalization-related competence protein ComEC/Rec2 [Eubacteriales bacterium]
MGTFIKRPLCLFCTLFLLVELLVTFLFRQMAIDYSPLEGEYVSLLGTVEEKEVTTVYNKETLQITLQNVAFYEISETTEEIIEQNSNIKQILCNIQISDSENIHQSVKIGSQILIEGKLANFTSATNPGQFDFKQYYENLGYAFTVNNAKIVWQSNAYSKGKEFLYACKIKIGTILDSYLTEEDSGVLQAMMLGDKNQLDEELEALYQRNGIAHILAISGLHISLLGMGLFQFLRRIGSSQKIAASVTIFVLWNYGLMTGMGISTFRAVVMFSIMVMGKAIGRTYDMITAMAVAAFVFLIENPFLLFNVSFQLSFMAIIGVGMFIPLLKEVLSVKRKILEGVVASLGISLATLPIILYYFYEIPIYSVFLNLLILPLMSILLLSAIFLCVVFFICEPLCFIGAYPITFILNIYKTICEIADQIPNGRSTIGEPEFWQIVFYYSIVVFLCIVKEKIPGKIGIYWLILSLQIVTTKVDKGFMITILDVGQGDGIVIETDSGKICMMDGGSTTVTNVGEYRIIPYLKSEGIEEIEVIFISHMDADHYNGIVELMTLGKEENITIKTIVLAELEEWDEAYTEMVNTANLYQIPVKTMKAGDIYGVDEVVFTALHPYEGEVADSRNNASLVLSLEYESFQALLTGDIEKEGEAYLLEGDVLEEMNLLEVEYDFLKVAHHGSATSTTQAFLDWSNPVFAAISCGQNNSYGHPNIDTLNRLEENEIPYFITMDCGAIHIEVGKNNTIKVTQFCK